MKELPKLFAATVKMTGGKAWADIKVLPCEVPEMFWKNPQGYFGDLKEFQPVFHRDGFYYCRNTGQVWHEFAGRAFRERRVDDFVYRLKMENHRPLLPCEQQAIRTLMQGHRCPSNLKELFYTDREWFDLRRTFRDVKMLKDFHRKTTKKTAKKS